MSLTFNTPQFTRQLEPSEIDALEAIKWIAQLRATDRVEALLIAASLSKIAAIAENARERVLREHPYTPPTFEEIEQKSAQQRRKKTVA